MLTSDLKRTSFTDRTRSCASLAVSAIKFLILLAFVLQTTACSVIGPRKTVKYIRYPVARGDTLYEIGQRFNVTLREIEEMNSGLDAERLQIGQIVKVPFKGQSLARTSNEAVGGGRAFSSQKINKMTTGLKKVHLGRARQNIGQLSWPVGGGKLTSRFGWRWFSFHEGIDIAAPVGTPVYAAHSGRVVYSGNGLSGYGNLVVIKSESMLTVYAHNDRNRVRVGDSVRRGQYIADVGETGHATGPHLHFETRVKDAKGRNVAVDPIVFFERS